jgi:hypothetical protein
LKKEKRLNEAVFSVTKSDIEKINSYSLKPLSEEEVFVFSVILCDNEIDRDFERFSVESLKALKELFKGVTGIFDHSMRAENQTARIFDTELITDKERTTSAGEPYTYLKAHCYMLRNEKNKSLIAEIEAGIKREVSVSCSVKRAVCSVCKAENSSCSHRPGTQVEGRLCHRILYDAVDAYEWSFVAVPAQKGARVTKQFGKTEESKRGEKSVTDILKKLGEQKGETVLDAFETAQLKSYIATLERAAADGEHYKSSLMKKALSLSAVRLPKMDTAVFKTVLESLPAKDLEALVKGFADEDGLDFAPQLIPEAKTASPDNSGFRI